MGDIFFEKLDDNDAFHQQDVHSISYWSNESDSVLSVHRNELLYEHPFGILAQTELHGVVGYIAVKELSHDGQVGQVGSLITHPNLKNKGAGSGLIKEIIKYAPTHLREMKASFAYGNPESTPIFVNLGGTVIGQREPAAATTCNDIIDLSDAMGLPGVKEASLADILNVNETRVG